MTKSRDAFRTISEVAEWMETPAHVLRFWESKFSQVKPVKRAGGRRYYRPADMELLGGIKKLLHDEGMTIKGVQKVLRDQGIAHVAGLSDPVDDTAVIADAPFIDAPEATDTVVPFHAPAGDAAQDTDTAPVAAEAPEPGAPDPVTADAQGADTPPQTPDPALAEDTSEAHAAPPAAPRENTQPELGLEAPAADADADTDAPEAPAPEEPRAEDRHPDTAPGESDPAHGFSQDPADSPMPSFLSKPLAPSVSASDPEGPQAQAAEAAPTAAPPMPERADTTEPGPAAPIKIPPDPDLSAITTSPGALTALAGLSRLTAADAEALRPVVDRLRAVQAKLGTQRRS